MKILENKPNIALIGMMGTFKSSAGGILSQLLNMEFVDSDKMIEIETDKTIPQLFELGEEYFREQESRVIKKLCNKKNIIISCGGGAVLKKENVLNLKKSCIIVLLTALPEVIFNRISDPSGRPLLKENFSKEKIAEIMQSRAEAYLSAADFLVDNTIFTAEQTAQKIVNIIS